MQVRPRDVVEIDRPDDADAEVGDAPARALEVGELEDDHVATVAAVALEVPAGGRPVLRGRDDLQELVAEREDRVAQSELAHARVGERLAEPELGAQLLGDGVELGGDEDRLAQAHAVGVHARGRYTRTSRRSREVGRGTWRRRRHSAIVMPSGMSDSM